MAEQASESEYESREDSESSHKNGFKEVIQADKTFHKEKENSSFLLNVDESGKHRHFQDQTDESDSSPDPILEFDKMKELTEIIRNKNKNIKELLLDINVLSDENDLLKNKLTETKDKLSDATTQINDLSIVIINTQSENNHYMEKIQDLENVNESLKNQVDDLILANKEQDVQMNEFALQIDSRINDWKELLESKELEIENLQKKSTKSIASNDEIDSGVMIETVKKYEEEVEILKTKLNEATSDLTNSIKTIETLNAQNVSLKKSINEIKTNEPYENSKSTNIIAQLKTELKDLILDKTDIEDVLKMKEIELSGALQKINKYETGELGLKEALTSYKKAKHQIKVRDEHINKLIAENNKHIHHRDQIQLENSIMRKKLNLSPEQPIAVDDILSKHAKRKKELDKALENLSALEEEKVSFQIKLRQKEKCIKKLCGYVNEMGMKIPENFISMFLDEGMTESQAFETVKSPKYKKSIFMKNDEIMESPKTIASHVFSKEREENEQFAEKYWLIKENYDIIIEENEVFRKGIHEIANVLKEKTKYLSDDAEFRSLQNFLKILDDRHNTQWYHPTMKILSESKMQKDSQEQLKKLLNDARKEILAALDLLETETRKTLRLEKEIDHLKKSQPTEEIESSKPIENLTYKDDENITPDYTNLKSITETVLKPADQKYISVMNDNLRHFHNQFKILNESMIGAFYQYNNEKTLWDEKEMNYKDEIENLKLTIDLQKKSKDAQEFSATVNDALERKLKYMEECLKQSRSTNEIIIADFSKHKIDKLKTINDLELIQQKLNFQIIEMQNLLRNTIPLDIFIKQNNLLNSTEMKYRSILNDQFKDIQASKGQQNNDDSNEQITILSAQIDIIRREKNDLEKLLNEELSKNTIFNSGDKNDSNELKSEKFELISSKQKLAYLENMNNVFASQFDSLNEKLNEFKKLLTASDERNSSLESMNFKLQEEQLILMNKLQVVNFSRDENYDFKIEIDGLKIENKKLTNHIDILTEQINNIQHIKLLNDLEVNMLRHQIVDLQSGNDSKAIIARLSSEILVTHLHTAEMHKKRERLSSNLAREREKTKHLEEILNEKDAQFNDFVAKTNMKINFLNTALQTLRDQYQGSIPMTTLENILNTRKELDINLKDFMKQKEEFESRRDETVNSFMLEKYKEFFPITKNICTMDEMIQCSHMVQLKINESKWLREKTQLIDSINGLKNVQKQFESKVELLEENLLMISFALGIDSHNEVKDDKTLKRSTSIIEVSNMDEYHDQDVPDKIPIPKPRRIGKEQAVEKINDFVVQHDSENLPGSPTKKLSSPILIDKSKISASVQTEYFSKNSSTQTDNLEKVSNESNEKPKTQILGVNEDSDFYKNLVNEKDSVIKRLQTELQQIKIVDKNLDKKNEFEEEENLRKLLEGLKSIESEKNEMIDQLKIKLDKEKDEHKKSNIAAQKQIIEMKMNMNALEKELNKLKNLMNEMNFNDKSYKNDEVRHGKIMELEAKCFQLQKDFDNEHSSIMSLKSECERWKNLAADRFANMEMLSKRLEEKHSHEVVSYKTETNHWLSELADAKHLISTLKMQMNDQSSSAIKQMAEKDTLIHNLARSNDVLKQHVNNLQMTMASTDPSFEIPDVDEDFTDESNKIDREVNFEDLPNEYMSSTKQKNWSEGVIDRLRREKYMIGKQNSLLRKQVQIISARERRSKLELQNIKSQMCRMTYVDNSKFSSNGADLEYLHRKIATLEQQLSEKQNSSPESSLKTKQLALWDKQKRWQETADRWKIKYDEKCNQMEKMERLYEAAKTTLHRLEKEKRSLDSRLSKYSRVSDGPTPSTATGDYDNHLEMLLQDKERLEDEVRSLKQLGDYPNKNSLIEKIESQERKITAYEIADKGKSRLVSEYEKLLEQNSLLSKQNLKLETEILELQLKLVGKRVDPDGSDGEGTCCKRIKQQNEHLENYVKLLKEENSKLIAKNITSDALDQKPIKTGTLSQNKRIGDLERTILTLRGLISGLQAENKKLLLYSGKTRKNSIPLGSDKSVDELQNEVSDLKEKIREKDNLLEKAKNLLRRATEKEKELIKEVTSLKDKN